MIWEVMKQYPKDLKAYDVMDSAWPGKIDDFCEYLEDPEGYEA
jgi:hypothetical protein